ncbi:ExeA family protein [Desulfogranum japonicum]|uniref:ExeA family protein n=1 Tax=Desulfogranum japonicum TaxID=231447 RepID=UPI00041345A9|nr:AAA family ATPase [Desulfogranum japonicum]
MYRAFYGLSAKPFKLTPDSKVVFRSLAHQEGLAILKYGVISKKGFLVLTANVGLGKTTLLQALVDSLDMGVKLCLLNNPLLYRDEFFSYLANKFGLPWDGNKAMFLIAFGELLKKAYEENERILLIIDEAHVLPVDLLEEIRLLSNLDVKGQDVLSIFLVGQPELNDLMQDDRLLPLRQRIGIRYDLKPLSLNETKQYILFRLRSAGARQPNIFTNEAVAHIHEVSKGTPRLINIVCDHALLTGFAENRQVINGELIKSCVEDLHFPGESTPLPLAPKTSKGKDLRKYMLVVLVVVFLLCAGFLAREYLPDNRLVSWLSSFLPVQWPTK